ncbi:MAG: O-antigen ligase family protein, partial [Alphaproteobacteria bacterium]
KYRRQTETGLGFFLGGRTEILISAIAIKDSPFIGHGSWAKDPYYASLLLQYRPELTSVYESGLIPTHSFLFGAWVEAGVVGAIFWLWIWILNARALGRVFTIREPLVPLFGLIGIVMAWDIIFSPYGAERRFIVPFYVVLAMFLLQMVEYWHDVGKDAARAGIRRMAGRAPAAR